MNRGNKSPGWNDKLDLESNSDCIKEGNSLTSDWNQTLPFSTKSRVVIRNFTSEIVLQKKQQFPCTSNA